MKRLIYLYLIVFTWPFTVLAQETYRIGALLHLSGEFAIQGTAFRQGAELACEEINRSALPGDGKLEIIFEDTQYKPLLSNTAARKLVTGDNLIGTIISTLVEAKSAAPILEKEKVPSIVLWDSSPELDQMGDFIFSIGPWAPASGETAANFAFDKLQAKRAAIIQVQTEWSSYVSDYFERRFRHSGGIVERFALDPNEQDFRTVILKAKAHKADVIYAPIDSNILPFFKQLRTYRLKSSVLTSDILDKELFDAGGDLFDGIYQTQSTNPDNPRTLDMIEKFSKKFGQAPPYLLYSSWAYDAVNVLATCLKHTGAGRDDIKDCLYSREFSGASGTIDFNEEGSAPRDLGIYRVKGSQLAKLE